MSKRLCTAGVRGSYSYVIVNNTDVVVARVHNEDDEDVIATHIDMEVAEKWVDTQLQTLLGRNYETD
jgi:hypothetical protein